MNAPNQWEMMLHCNMVSHWLGAFTKRSLYMHGISGSFIFLSCSKGICLTWFMLVRVSYGNMEEPWINMSTSYRWDYLPKSHDGKWYGSAFCITGPLNGIHPLPWIPLTKGQYCVISFPLLLAKISSCTKRWVANNLRCYGPHVRWLEWWLDFLLQ